MNSPIPPEFPLFCPYSSCSTHSSSTHTGQLIHSPVRKRGSFTRKGSLKRIRRYHCLGCLRSFSEATFQPEFRQKKRALNSALRNLLCSTVSERRAALLLGVNRKLVAQRIQFFSTQDQKAHQQDLQARVQTGELQRTLQFDEMETFEHTKCKPLSIGLAVNEKSREILGISVASMPASGLLAEISRSKYGWRADDRPKAAAELFQSLTTVVHPQAHFRTDQNPKYPHWLKACFPQAQHTAHKGRRGAIVGQGELKKIGFDPLFSLNHTAAMIRANVNRLLRRTWCTTKKAKNLLARLWIYVRYHNTVLLHPTPSLH